MTSITSGAVLSAALQNNILSLQRTQSEISETQLRLATGLKVNSATDNPYNFFEASALNHRAASLETLLSGIGQAISTIQQASSGVSAVLNLTEQAESITSDALTNVAAGQIEARINGDRDLTGITDLTNINGVDNNDDLLFSFIEPDGSVNSGNTITISNGDTPTDLINSINNIQDSNGDQVLEARLDSSGGLEILDRNGNRFEIEFQNNAGNADSTLASGLGFSALTIDELDNNTAVTRVTVSAEPSLTTVPLFDSSTGVTATASTVLPDLTDSSSGSSDDLFRGGANDQLNISINGGTATQVIADLITETLQDLIDGINNNPGLNSKIEATFDASTGELNIRAIDNTVESIQLEIVEGNVAAGPAPRIRLQRLGFGIQVLTTTDNSGNTSSESIQLGSAAGALADLETEFDTLLSQIDELVADAVFSGINLLSGDTLTTFFNETRTSSLITTGETVTSSGLGLGTANFGRSTTINESVSQLDSATDTLEGFSSSLSNDLSIIQTRETFTNETINNLEEGADKLTVADQNEEGAKLLALQTRQLLGISSLSLGLLAQQSTLRLF